MTSQSVIPQIAKDTASRRHPEDGEMVHRAVYWVYVEVDGARYDHDAILDSYDAVERLAERIFRAQIAPAHILASAHWAKWTNPYAGDLEPFGPAWEDEQRERLGLAA
jgi:hypothetical protein